jgi:hypothetical protein
MYMFCIAHNSLYSSCSCSHSHSLLLSYQVLRALHAPPLTRQLNANRLLNAPSVRPRNANPAVVFRRRPPVYRRRVVRLTRIAVQHAMRAAATRIALVFAPVRGHTARRRGLLWLARRAVGVPAVALLLAGVAAVAQQDFALEDDFVEERHGGEADAEEDGCYFRQTRHMSVHTQGQKGEGTCVHNDTCA